MFDIFCEEVKYMYVEDAMRTLIAILLIFMCTSVFARTTINVNPANPNITVPPGSEDEIAQQLQDITDKNHH